MQPLLTLALTTALALAAAPPAPAASRRECQLACSTQILACLDVCVPFGGGSLAPGGRKLAKACRKGVLKRCRKEGVATCQTTPTTLPAGTSTTLPGGTSTTTSLPGATSTTTPVATTTTSTAPPSGLAGLIGRWRFQFTIISTFVEVYDFDHVELVDGIPTLVGSDEFGGLVIVSRTADLGGGVPFEFAMLDPGFILCDFYVFNRTGASTISGERWQTGIDFDGSCGDLTGGPHPLSGTRLAASLGLGRPSPRDRSAAHQQRLEESVTEGDGLADPAVARLLQRMREGAR
jgi:hypothetical protein